jgi:hypothetical protein
VIDALASSRSHRLPDQGAEQVPVVGLKLLLLDPAPQLTEPIDRDLELLRRRAFLQPCQRERGILTYELRAPIVAPIRCHGTLIADLRPDGKREKEDGTIWTTYEWLDRRSWRPVTIELGSTCVGRVSPSRLPEQ